MRCLGDRFAHRSLRHSRRVGAALSGLHVRKLVPIGRDAARRKDVGSLGEKMVSHARARAVREHVQRSEEHTSELQSHSFISYAVFCLKKKKNEKNTLTTKQTPTYLLLIHPHICT